MADIKTGYSSGDLYAYIHVAVHPTEEEDTDATVSNKIKFVLEDLYEEIHKQMMEVWKIQQTTKV